MCRQDVQNDGQVGFSRQRELFTEQPFTRARPLLSLRRGTVEPNLPHRRGGSRAAQTRAQGVYHRVQIVVVHLTHQLRVNSERYRTLRMSLGNSKLGLPAVGRNA